jgi:4,5:9,10-diseco-3-hydroxy-5,9,17-trioxoandrosta-1(10),2-diene-4-oate hydrolase
LVRPTARVNPTDKRERYIEAAGTRVRFIEAGTRKPGPPLVLLHGYRAGADYWFPHPLPAFAEEMHVIAPDLPGYGYSGRLPKYSLGVYAAFFGEFLNAMNLESVNLMGHSMGAQVAIAAAARQPERVSKLVLVDSAGLPRLEPNWQMPLTMIGDSSVRHVKLYPLMMRLALRATASREGLRMLQDEHVSNILKWVTMPTLIVWGSRDRVIPMEHGALLARYIPQARLAVIRNAGHMPFYQKPQEFNQLVLGFLGK